MLIVSKRIWKPTKRWNKTEVHTHRVLFANGFFWHIPREYLRLKLLSKHCYQEIWVKAPVSFISCTSTTISHLLALEIFSAQLTHTHINNKMEKKKGINRSFMCWFFGLVAFHPSTYCTFATKAPTKSVEFTLPRSLSPHFFFCLCLIMCWNFHVQSCLCVFFFVFEKHVVQ